MDNTFIGGTCFATLGKIVNPIGAFGTAVNKVTMVTNAGAVKAVPSDLSVDGTSFSDQWVSAGP